MSSHSRKYEEKKRKKVFGKIFMLGFILVAIVVLVVFLMRASFLQIDTVSIEGATTVPKESIQATALKALSGSYLKVVPFTNIIFFPKSKIKESISDNFKDIQNFSISRSGLTKITISLTDRIPAAIACSGFRDETSIEDCYWSDGTGYIFGSVASSSASSKTTYNHYYIPTDNGDITPGKNFIAEARFKELENFTKGALLGGLTPLGILMGDNGEYEMYIKNKTGDSEITIYFDDRKPFDSTLGNLLTFWQNTLNNRKATTTPVFDYINLKFGNTIYYSKQ